MGERRTRWRARGGYLPFEFDVVALLREGDNELLVRVVDATDDRDL